MHQGRHLGTQFFSLRTAFQDRPEGPFSTCPTRAFFVPLPKKTPENTWVTQQYRPLSGPREGRGDVPISDFVAFQWVPPRT